MVEPVGLRKKRRAWMTLVLLNTNSVFGGSSSGMWKNWLSEMVSPVLIDEEFALVASGKGELCDAVVGQWVVVVGYVDVLGAIHWAGLALGEDGEEGCTIR